MDSRKTTRYLTIYERAQIIGLRAQQIAITSGCSDRVALNLAEKELNDGKIPLSIKRKIDGDRYETIKLDDGGYE